MTKFSCYCGSSENCDIWLVPLIRYESILNKRCLQSKHSNIFGGSIYFTLDCLTCSNIEYFYEIQYLIIYPCIISNSDNLVEH